MDRTEKEAAVAELTDRLKEAEAVFAVDYRGISVTQAAELRRRLADAGASFRVVKNRLAKRAAADAGTEGIDDLLVGPTALTLIEGDAVVAAKAISIFSRENDVLEFKGGLMDGASLDVEGFKTIARLPGVEVLRGQLVGVAASPITGLVRGLGSLVSGLAIALGQIAEQGLVSGEAPAEEVPAEATPAAEAEEPKEDAASEEAPAEPEVTEAEEETSDEEQADGDEQPPSDETESDGSAESGSEEVEGEAETSEEE